MSNNSEHVGNNYLSGRATYLGNKMLIYNKCQ